MTHRSESEVASSTRWALSWPAAFSMALGLLLASAMGPAVRRARGDTASCVGDCTHDDRVTVDELVLGVNMALGTVPLDRCPDFDPQHGGAGVTITMLIAAVNNALVGCADARTNHAPHADDLSFTADPATPYVQKQLSGSDPDGDTLAYELVAGDSGPGYGFAYLSPDSGVLYLTVAADFQGTIALPYRVSDGALFSNTATVTVDVHPGSPDGHTGLQPVDPQEYASNPRGFFNGAVLGAPGNAPTLPAAVDLSNDFPLPGNQGIQSSCVAWALGYAIKSYHERVELGWSLQPLAHVFSPAYMYNRLNGGEDDGLVYREALDFLVNEGDATLDLMPYSQFDFLTQPSAAARQQAVQFKAKTWEVVNSILELKNALANRLPVFMGIHVFSDLRRLKGPGSVYNTFTEAFEGGHGVAVVGYDDQRYGGAFKIMNSWGQGFGDNGYFWLPYAVASASVKTAEKTVPVVQVAVVVEDAPDVMPPDLDPVRPPPPGELPDLQVTDWHAYFQGRPGGAGTLQYTVTNTGVGTAPAGANVALVLSRDPTFRSGNTLVVYEPIPFAMAPGTTAFRDANNAIAFTFPPSLAAGQYYMALWVDIWNDVVEAREDDNISPATGLVQIENTLPDLQIQTWYARWDALGRGALTYDVINNGASTAPAGWDVSFVLSPDETIGDGNEIFLFSEVSPYTIAPGGTLYRNDSIPAAFSIFSDNAGYPVPTGVYYLALWVNANHSLTESNTGNNASLSWGTLSITNGLGAGVTAGMPAPAMRSASMTAMEAYNGKRLPAPDAPVRMVRIRETAPGSRVMELLGDDDTDPGPATSAEPARTWSKEAHARHQVIFPIAEAKPMPSGD